MIDQKEPRTFLGFDYGMSFVGVAVGQTVTRTAKPLTTLKVEKGIPRWNQVKELIDTWRPDALIVGLPLKMDGSNQLMTEKALTFSEELSKRFSIPVHTIDERLTTVEAKACLFEQGGYRALNRTKVDAMAAKIILEAWMASLSN